MYNIIIASGSEAYIKDISELDVWKECSDTFNVAYRSTDGDEVLQLISTPDIHILIMDTDMERPDGFDILRIINEKDLYHICVILTGERIDYDTVKKALVLGSFDYLVKPVSNDDMYDVLHRAAKRLEKCLKNKRSSETDHLCSEISDHLLRGGTDIGSRTDALIISCIRHKNSSYSNAHRIIHAAERIYNDVCTAHEWIADLIPEPDAVLQNITSADDRDTRDILYSFFSEISDTINKFYPPGLYGITKAAIDHILENRFRKLTLASVSESCFVNKAHLSHMFRQNTGMSLTEYVSGMKMQMLRKMVISSSKQLSEIAEILGYDDYKYMGRIFKSTYGVPPSEFRNDSDI